MWWKLQEGGSFDLVLLGVLKSRMDAKINVYTETISSSVSRQINDKAYIKEYEMYERQDSMDRIRSARNKSNGAGGVEEGSHAQLLQRNGEYAELYNAQAEYD